MKEIKIKVFGVRELGTEAREKAHRNFLKSHFQNLYLVGGEIVAGEWFFSDEKRAVSCGQQRADYLRTAKIE